MKDTELIFNPNIGDFQRVKNIKVARHRTPDLDGNETTLKCIEFTVVGKNSEWEDWADYEDFKKINKKIEI